jgi:TPR repeat protein
VKWYRKAADQKLPKAQYSLGFCYANGTGVEQDVEQAVKWYRKAADQGNADAQCNLGVCYDNGTKAANWGNCNALERIAQAILNGELGYTANAQKSLPWFEKAEAAGSAAAKEKLDEWRKNWVKEAKFKEQLELAEAGNDIAAIYVAWALETGHGAQRDLSVAQSWYKKAANWGNCNALERIAQAILNGELGYTANAQQSLPWFEKAEAAGSAAAKEKLDEWRKNWEKEAKFKEHLELAEAGNDIAAMYVAWALETGHGAQRDLSVAQSWYKFAAAKGNIAAILTMAQAYMTFGKEWLVSNAHNNRTQNLNAALELAREAERLGSQEAPRLLKQWNEELSSIKAAVAARQAAVAARQAAEAARQAARQEAKAARQAAEQEAKGQKNMQLGFICMRCMGWVLLNIALIVVARYTSFDIGQFIGNISSWLAPIAWCFNHWIVVLGLYILIEVTIWDARWDAS